MTTTERFMTLIEDMIDEGVEPVEINEAIRSLFPESGVRLTDEEAAITFVAARRYLGPEGAYELFDKLRSGWQRHNSCGAVA